jgi:hypothetical protein
MPVGRVPSQASPRERRGVHIDTGTGFSQNNSVLPSQDHSINAPYLF